MKKIFKIIVLFLVIVGETFSITTREKIERDLRKLNVDENLIIQTIAIEEQMADKTFEGPFAETNINKVKKLADRNLENYHLISHLVKYYLGPSTVEEAKINKKYIDAYLANVPDEWERLAVKISYNEKIGNIEESQKYYQEFVQKFSNKGIGQFFLANFKTSLLEKKESLAKALNLFKREIANGNKEEITEEEMFLFQNTYDLFVLEEFIQNQQFQKVIDYYIQNMANQSSYSHGVIEMYQDRLVNQMSTIANINQNFLNNNKANLQKIQSSKLFIELEARGRVFKGNN